MTVGEMLDRMSSAELTEWQAYERVAGPLGQERDDALAAMTAFYVTKALGAKKARLDKMMPQWDRPRQTWQQIKRTLKALTRAGGGEIVTKEGGSDGEPR